MLLSSAVTAIRITSSAMARVLRGAIALATETPPMCFTGVRTLNLPLLVIESDGTVRSPVSRIGALTVSKPGPRRNRGLFRGRRSRYIRRRKTGADGGMK